MFAPDSNQPTPGRRRSRSALAVSALGHAALLGWFALRAPASPSGSVIGVVFFPTERAAPIPPATPPPERAAERERQTLLDRLVQPSAVPDLAATPERGARAPSPPPAPGGDDAPADAGGNTTRPILVTRVQPAYTRAAQMAGLEGDVVLEAVIDERGRVGQVRVLRGLDLGLDEAAAQAVRRWRFKPSTRNGKPVKVFYILTVHFRL